MTSSLSILGLYNYDPQIFDKLALPDGVDRSLLVNNLVMELGCLEVLYPSAPFMADMVELWSNKELPTWNRLYSAMQLEYNPIENYDRQEEWTDERDETRENSISDSTVLDGQVQNSGSITETISNSENTVEDGVTQNSGGTTQTTSKTTDAKVTGYNSNTLVPDSQQLESGSVGTVDTTKQDLDKTTTRTGSQTRTMTDTTKQETDSTTTRTGSGSEDTTGTVEHVGRVHGNIGVTTSQQMLQSELDLVPQLNIINYIISSFKSRFCILVY